MEDNRKVECCVKQCKYQSDDKACHADHIVIAPENAATTNETGCATFKK